MVSMSLTWKQLLNLKPTNLTVEDLSRENKIKALNTARHSMALDASQEQRSALKRCVIATLAEQMIAECTNGRVMDSEFDKTNPFSFAYDVISNEGMRIEVKTHQSDSRWINVHTKGRHPYPHGSGIDLDVFLTYRLSDLIIILETDEVSPGFYRFIPRMMGDQTAFLPGSGLVQESKYENGGWYLRSCSEEEYQFKRFTY